MPVVKVEIVRPVNPVGISFIKYLGGALRRNGVELDSDWNKAIQYLGMKIAEKIGKDKWITGEIEIDTDNMVFRVLRLEVWEKKEANIEPFEVKW